MNIEKVSTKNFTMNYFKFGQGKKTMVILPGLSVKSVMESADAIRDEYAVMEKDFTVYVFERRNDLPETYPIKEMAMDTAEALKALGLKDIYLFGASQGGMIAMEIALEYPELVKKLALGSTAAHVDNERYGVIEHWTELAKQGDRVGLYLDFGEKLYPEKMFEVYRQTLITIGESVTDSELERFITIAKGTRDFDVSDRLRNIKCPVLVTGSFDDAVLGVDAFVEITKILPNVSQYLYNGYGHAVFDTAPDFRDRLLEFFVEN